MKFIQVVSKLIRRPRSAKVISKVVYGTIVVTALLLTLQEYSENPWQIILSILTTMIVIGMAESYSGIVGERLEKRTKLESHVVRGKIYEGIVIIATSQIPIFVFILAGFELITVQTAFFIAPLLSLVLLFFYGLAYGILSGRGKRFAITIGLVDVAFGLSLILLKALTH